MTRVGHGYDIHRLVAGRPLILGGIKIDFPLGLSGHSDADLVCHAVADALLGAAALGDIGQHFPDTDPAFKDACSLDLLGQVAGMVRAHGYEISNVDAVVVAETPKLSPYVPLMKKMLSDALGMAVDRISIKARTAEKLGPVGEGLAMECFAVVLVAEGN